MKLLCSLTAQGTSKCYQTICWDQGQKPKKGTPKKRERQLKHIWSSKESRNELRKLAQMHSQEYGMDGWLLDKHQRTAITMAPGKNTSRRRIFILNFSKSTCKNYICIGWGSVIWFPVKPKRASCRIFALKSHSWTKREMNHNMASLQKKRTGFDQKTRSRFQSQHLSY